MSAPPALKAALNKKKTLKAAITRLTTDINKKLDEAQIELYESKQGKYTSELADIFEIILLECKEDEYDTYAEEQSTISETLDEVWLALKREKIKITATSVSSTNSTNNSSTESKQGNCEKGVRLPVINLECFSGQIEQWVSFSDLFKVSVHNNTSLSNAQKLSYLKTSLKGDAARIIQSISICDANYATAWNLLEERYANKREQVYAHIRKFMKISPMHSESASAILALVDNTNECIRSLEVLGQKIEGFAETIMIYTLCEKLHANTRAWWERELRTPELLPSLSDLISFLKGQARTLEASKSNFIVPQVKRNNPGTRHINMLTSVKGSNQKCLKCEGKCRFLYKCPEFLRLTVLERNEFVRKNGVCFRCLDNISKHPYKKCKSSYICQKQNCGQLHSSVLHYNRQNEANYTSSNNTHELLPEKENLNNPSTQYSAASINSQLNPNARIYDQSNKPSVSNSFCMATALSKKEIKNEWFPAAETLNQSVPKKCMQKEVLLSTCVGRGMNSYGFSQSINILLDQGSQQSYISNKCINRLNLRKQSVNNVSVNCLTGKQITIKSKVLITISNESGGYVRSIECLAVPRIVERLPINHLNISSLQFPNVKLANPNFNNPNAIDLLISAEYVYEILQPGQIKIPNSNITLVNSVFGYVVTGVAEVCNDKNRVYRGDVNGAQYTNSVYCGMVTREEDLNEELKKFWVIENACYDTTEINKTEEELLCEKHYVGTHKRDHMGKYIVQMPLRDNPLCLGESRDIAIRKLNSQYKHLVKEPEYLKLYNNFIEEYLSLGHMEKVSEDSGNNATYYIPHLGVRSHSVTTPLRIVFNASSLTNNGKSLNDLQYNGGTVQDDLYSIMIRFRKHKIVFIADIEKMYRAIWMDPSQRDLLRIVWKYGEKDPIQTFRLKTVSYGLTSSAFLSTRTLKQLAIDEGEHFPLAAKVTQSDFYVDDVLTGEKDLERAKILKDELNVMLQKGGMRLHKWATNAQELLGDGTVTCRDYHFSVETKTLGVVWVPMEDCFIFRLNITTPTIITKRSVLSNIATIFDPVGLIQPVLTNAKAFMQRLWLLKVEWNDPLPAKEASEWENLVSLQSVNSITVPRYVNIDNAEIVEVHGFCDASEKAYGAVIYVKCISSSGDISSNLLTSKSRVAPTKTMTIPKLELSGALLLAQLYTKIVKALKTTIHRTYLWCDSKIVLAWLQKEPMQLKQFIANRVNTIQNLTKISDWRHVPSDRNAADILSRGTEMKNLIRNEMWWFGPAFIKQFEFPETILDPPAPEYHEGLKEHKNSMTGSPDSIALAVTQGGGGSESLVDYLLNRSNNFTKILYVLSYLFRFVFNVRNPNGKKQGPISRNEIEEAKAFIVKDVQCRYFPSEISRLQKGKLLSPSSTIKNLNPYLDDNEILRVGGRLHNSNLNDNVKHPIILPAKAKLTEIIVEYFHIKNLHLGPQALLYSVRSIFWPVHGRNICRKVVHRCVTCFRARPVVSEQLMGNLPKERVSKNFPFSCSGVDYCGPFEIKYKGQRRGIYRKVYVCIFICMVTKAIHLEMVGDLTTEAFIATLKRFSARRGKPQKVFSDNARNFLGASAEIKRLHKIMSAPDNHLAHYLSLENIEWSFIAPRGPHQGGLWEAGVKAFKYHFKRVVGNAKLSYEEFLTIMNQIEGMLNSRPVTPLTSDIDDLEVLTPGHFLIGRPMNQIVEPDLVDLEANRLNLWQKTTKLVQQIWKRWKNSYLNTLQQRTKWMFLKDNVAVGNIVLIKEDNLPMYKWALGRILEIKPGRDKIVRVAIVKTQNGILTRPITKLCVLPIEK